MVVLKPADFPAEISQQVVCGANSLTPTNFNVYCRIISTFPNGQAASCSAAKVGVNRLSTAGHCVYYKELVSPGTYCRLTTAAVEQRFY